MDFDFTKNISLENKRAHIRPLQPEDLKNLLHVATDEDLVQYSPYSIHTKELLEEFIMASIEDRKNNFRYPFIIYDKELKEYAGSTSIANVSNADKRFEIGWTWIGKKFQKTGLNRNCKFLLLQYGFDILGFERIEFKADERNMISRIALEKIGAKMEGILRSHTLVKNGFRRNSVYYSILQSEWKDVSKNLLLQINNEK